MVDLRFYDPMAIPSEITNRKADVAIALPTLDGLIGT
jgi:hypothetical protein